LGSLPPRAREATGSGKSKNKGAGKENNPAPPEEEEQPPEEEEEDEMAPKKGGKIESKDLSVPDVTPQINALEKRCDALEALVKEIRGADFEKLQVQIDGLKEALEGQKSASTSGLDAVQALIDNELKPRDNDLEEKINATNVRIDDLKAVDLKAISQEIEDRTAEFRAADQALHEKVDALDAKNQQVAKEHEDRMTKETLEREQNVTELRSDLEALRAHTDKEFARSDADMAAAVAKINQEMADLDALHKQLLDTKSTEITTELNRVNQALTDRIDKERTFSDASREALRENREAAEQAFREEMDTLDRKNTQIRENANEDLMNYITNLDDKSTYALHVVERLCSNATCIKWRIASSELEGKMRVSMFSDKFHCHGARNLKLELRIDKHVDGTTDSLGDTSLYLWAPQGQRISFRLWVGEPVGARASEHSKGKSTSCDFHYLQEGRYGAKSFFQLAHFMSDHLMVGVEILEVEQEVQYWDGDPGSVLDPRGTGSKKAGGEVKLADGRVVDKATAELINPTPTKLTAICMSNMRLHETMNEQMALIKSRYCKRSEWKITHAEELLSMYPPGRALCSKPFCAAGLEDLQFVIYPRGMGGADGYCSLLISAPAGTFIKGFIHMGKQARSLEHTWAERGQYGRANFCRWDNAVENDTVVAALEIIECMSNTAESGGLRLTSQVPQSALQDVQEIPRAPQPDEKTPAAKRALYGNLSPVDAPAKGSKVKKDKSLAWLRKIPGVPAPSDSSFNETHSGAFGATGGFPSALSSQMSAPDIRPQSSGTLPGIARGH
jgi:hypothetical protein